MEQVYNISMKKLLMILSLLLVFVLPSFCQDSILRDTSNDEIIFSADKPFSLIKTKNVETDTKGYNFTTKEDFKPRSLNDYNPTAKSSMSFSREKSFGNFLIGTQNDHTVSSDTYSGTNTYFTRYTKDKFSLNTSYQNKALTSFAEQRRGMFMFSPEYKINEKFSFQNRYSTSLLDRSRKNELVFSIKPFKDDRMNFDVGAGQVYSVETAMPTRSQLNFSTKFRF